MIKTLIAKSSEHGRSELKRIDYLDGWRGLAIVAVLIHHFFTIRVFDLGRMGVDIFFVLSGMLMSNILFVKRVPLSTFYKRRISRILPVFFLYVSLICAISYVLQLSPEHKNYFYLLTFLRSYIPTSPDIWHTGIPVGHIWSLNVEEHSYIILSIITLIAALRGKEHRLLIGMAMGMIALHYAYIRYPQIASVNYEYKTEIVASHLFLSAGYFLVRERVKPYVRSWMPVLAFLLGVLCYHRQIHWSTSWLFSPFLFAFAVNHLDAIPELLKRFLSGDTLRLFGICSYSIYLWQQPFYYLTVHYGDRFPFDEMVFMVLACVVGGVSFYCVENPIRRYLNNNW